MSKDYTMSCFAALNGLGHMKVAKSTIRMHDLVMGLFINRYEFGWSL